jgi:hypothetical protein
MIGIEFQGEVPVWSHRANSLGRRIEMSVAKKEIIEGLENLKAGECLKLKLSPTFGGRTVILEINPAFPQKGEKKYFLRWADDEARAKAAAPFMTSDKAKKLAEWVADRVPEWLGQPPTFRKAA